MVGSLNKVCLIGNSGADPEIRYSQDNSKIANFSMATTESWQNKEGKKEERTEWHKIIVFSSSLAELVDKYVKKGTKLYIEGQLRTRKWTDNNGVERYTTEIILTQFKSTLLILDSSNQQSVKNNTQSNNNFGDDDIPF